MAPSIKVAEAAKVIENTQRDINIAFVNELSNTKEKLCCNSIRTIASWIITLDNELSKAGNIVVKIDPAGTYPFKIIGPVPLENPPVPKLYPSPITVKTVVQSVVGLPDTPDTNRLLIS